MAQASVSATVRLGDLEVVRAVTRATVRLLAAVDEAGGDVPMQVRDEADAVGRALADLAGTA